MLHIGYLIILDCQSIKKISFEIFPFLSCRGWKTTKQVVPRPPWEPPPTPTPK